jgi:hypothetical protein
VNPRPHHRPPAPLTEPTDQSPNLLQPLLGNSTQLRLPPPAGTDSPTRN